MDCKVTGEHVMFIDSGVFTHHSRFTSTAHSITHNPHHLTFGLSDPNKAITHLNCPMAISWYMEEQHEIRTGYSRETRLHLPADVVPSRA